LISSAKQKKNSFPNFGQKSYEHSHVNNCNSLIVSGLYGKFVLSINNTNTEKGDLHPIVLFIKVIDEWGVRRV